MSELLETVQPTNTVIGIEVTRLLLRAVVLQDNRIIERYQIPLEYSHSISARLAIFTSIPGNP